MTYAFQTPDKLCFILDLMNGGDLHYHLSQHGVFTEDEMRFYAAEVILVRMGWTRYGHAILTQCFDSGPRTYAQAICGLPRLEGAWRAVLINLRVTLVRLVRLVTLVVSHDTPTDSLPISYWTRTGTSEYQISA